MPSTLTDMAKVQLGPDRYGEIYAPGKPFTPTRKAQLVPLLIKARALLMQDKELDWKKKQKTNSRKPSRSERRK